MKFYIYIIALAILFSFFSSCSEKFDDPEPIRKKNIENLNVSSSFDFSTTKEITARFTTNYQSEYCIVEVYSSDPNKGGSIIATGKFINNTYQQKMIVPSFTEVLYFRLKSNNGLSKFFSSNIINGLAEVSYILETNQRSVSTETYDCNSNCTQTISVSGNYDLSINAGEKICIPEGISITGGINMNGGTLSICGSANLSYLNTNGSSHVILGQSGSLTLPSFNFNSNLKLTNYSQSFYLPNTINGEFHNYGNINHAGNLNINSDGKIYNHGIINISGSLNNNGFIDNQAQFNVIILNQNSSGRLINNCQMAIGGNLTQMSSQFENNSYMSIGGVLQISEGASIYMGNSAFINTNTLNLYGELIGDSNNYSRIEISNHCALYSGSHIYGLIDICDADGIELSDGSTGSEVQYCQNIIPTTDCNPGIGSVISEDTDNDGISNSNDRFADDPERAFINYFPEKNEGTFAFEDLWPAKGDFDFNDIVIRYQYELISNNEGWVKEIRYTFRLAAVGGAFSNGFGIEFPTSRSNVKTNTDVSILSENFVSINSLNIENNQNNAVVILFDNALNVMEHPGEGYTGINTENGSVFIQPKSFTGTIIFKDPVDIANQAPFNPFIFINSDRGREVHLMGHAPTSLANYEYFNTLDDASSTDMYYKTSENMPWALHFFNEFDYPIEKAEITSAHLKFYDWANSEGNLYPDWYMDIPNYRNEAFIYQP